MENNNGKGIFYGVIGVATLVVAIIGATFAYFSATAESTNDIQGTAATAGLELTVAKTSTGATGGLVPLAETDLQSAVTGATGKSACVDQNDNSACQIYSITIRNSGTSAIAVDGKINLAATAGTTPASTFTNLKWVELSADGTTVDNAATKHPMGETGNNFKTNLSLAAGATQTYYIAVYINNTTGDQKDTDKGSFNGTVSFNAVGGTNGVVASFTQGA